MFRAFTSAFVAALSPSHASSSFFSLSAVSTRSVRRFSLPKHPRRPLVFMSDTPPPSTPSNLDRVQPADLRQEMTRSYMEYAMSVILGRAIPDVRDGFKPVHRRILYAMHQLSLNPSGPFRKSARVVGEVLGKYHPHGDSAVYDALVRMAQSFSMSQPLINGHGNFGSTDGDPPAAMRYTECKIFSITRDAVLADMDRDTVSFHPNFDGSEIEPLVLPLKFPNLLVNGTSGIAVGMATNIPPHNLTEVCRATTAVINNPLISDDALFDIVPAPDFPTGGQILGTAGAREVYATGRGRVIVRACVHTEVLPPEGSRRIPRDALVVTQLPFQVNKAALVAKIADLVNSKKLEGIADLRDESDRSGTRIVVELKRDAKAPLVLRHLFKRTALQSSVSANMHALEGGRFPRRLSLRQILDRFLEFRRDTLRRRVTHDLAQADERLHIVRGLMRVQESVDEVVACIRAAQSLDAAREALLDQFELSERQANAVLDLQLRRLTALEGKRLANECKELVARVTDLQKTLDEPARIDSIMTEELREIGSKYGTSRRTAIIPDDVLETADLDELSLLSNEQNVITVTRKGYVKRMPTSMFVNQNRGTRGKRGIGRLRAGDKIDHLFTCMTHDTLVAVSAAGIAYHLEAHKVPTSGLGSRGVPILQLIPAVPAGENMAAVLPVGNASKGEYLVMLTRKGYIKKMSVQQVVHVNSRGKRIILLQDGDELKWVKKCHEEDSVTLWTRKGLTLRFSLDSKGVRSSGRASRGVAAIRLYGNDEIADMDVITRADEEFTETEEEEDNDCFVLAITESGRGKRVSTYAFRNQRRGGKGVIGIRLRKQENGSADRVVAAQLCRPDDSAMLIASDGTIVKTKAESIPVHGRMTQGVRIQKLGENTKVAAVTVFSGVLADEDDEGDDEIMGESDEEVDDDGYDDDEDDEEGADASDETTGGEGEVKQFYDGDGKGESTNGVE